MLTTDGPFAVVVSDFRMRSSPSPGSRRPGGSAFGAPCTTSNDCSGEFNLCGTLTQLGSGCTKSCTADADCPVGSNGARKCNTQQFCRW